MKCPSPRKYLAAFLTLICAVQLTAQDTWNDKFKRFKHPVVLEAPNGMKVLDRPAIDAKLLGTTAEPQRGIVSGFVPLGNLRFYVTKESYDEWIDTGKAPSFLYFDGEEVLPPLPKLKKRVQGIDPDTGEDAIIEVYEATTAVEAASQWPVTDRGNYDAFYPATVKLAGPVGENDWEVLFELHPNKDAPLFNLPFTDDSFEEMMSGNSEYKVIRLLSSPSEDKLVLSGTGNRENILGLLRAGCVFLAAFNEGKLIKLSTGGDAWSSPAPTSRLSIPAVQKGQSLSFLFYASTRTGIPTQLQCTPNRIVGADYTKYSIIEDMGAPFVPDTANDFETQRNWTVSIHGDQSIALAAPLWDGRGAPGMIELEGIDLDPEPAQSQTPPDAVSNLYSWMPLAKFAEELPPEIEKQQIPAGWLPLTQTKVGTVPATQRVLETDGLGGADGL